MMKAKGKGLLKVVGILLIIFGAFGIFSGVSSMAMPSIMTDEIAQVMEQTGTLMDDNTYIMLGIAAIVFAIVDITAGIIGIVNCNKPHKAQICFLMGILMIVIQLGNLGYSAFTGAFTIMSIVPLIMPMLYFIGATLNKNMEVPAADTDQTA